MREGWPTESAAQPHLSYRAVNPDRKSPVDAVTTLPPTALAPSFVALIPARLASTRLPNKPLADIGGRPMVVRVAEQARRSGARLVAVATDSPEVASAVRDHGFQALITRSDHLSGTDRLAEAAAMLGLAEHEIVVNVQGDEPLLPPELISAVARELAQAQDCAIATAAHPIHELADYLSPNVVKAVVDSRQRALYFSRAPVPFDREFFLARTEVGNGVTPSATSATSATSAQAAKYDGIAEPVQAFTPVSPRLSHLRLPLRHIGLYAYRAGFLAEYPSLAPTAAESLESLEQLRALGHGYRIFVLLTDSSPPPGVDTPADLERVRRVITGVNA